MPSRHTGLGWSTIVANSTRRMPTRVAGMWFFRQKNWQSLRKRHILLCMHHDLERFRFIPGAGKDNFPSLFSPSGQPKLRDLKHRSFTVKHERTVILQNNAISPRKFRFRQFPVIQIIDPYFHRAAKFQVDSAPDRISGGEKAACEL